MANHPIVLIDEYYNFLCPHCNTQIQVKQNELNCKIFRCGILKSNGNPIPPHSKKEYCDKLKNDNMIYGCGKPFIFKDDYVEICDYV